MSVESPVRAEANWFLGEVKVLQFTVANVPVSDPITGWTFEWSLHPRRGTEAVLYKRTGQGITAAAPDQVSVTVAATDTQSLRDQSYNYVLRRVDAGSEQVLAYGPAVIRTASGAGS